MFYFHVGKGVREEPVNLQRKQWEKEGVSSWREIDQQDFVEVEIDQVPAQE